EGVEDPMAVAAAEVQDRVAAPTVDDQAIGMTAAGAGQAVGMQPVDELGIARRFIHQVGDREVHGGLRMGAMWVESPDYPPPAPGCKRPTHHLAYMSQLFSTAPTSGPPCWGCVHPQPLLEIPPMQPSTRTRPRRPDRGEHLGKPNGLLAPRVQAVGPEHF